MQTPEQRGLLSRGTKSIVKGVVNRRIEELIDQPTKESTVEVEKQVWRAVASSSPEATCVYDPAAVGVDLGDNATVGKSVEIIRDGQESRVSAFCFDREKAVLMAGDFVAEKGEVTKIVLDSMICYPQGCIFAETGPDGELRVITEPLEVVGVSSLPDQPP